MDDSPTSDRSTTPYHRRLRVGQGDKARVLQYRQLSIRTLERSIDMYHTEICASYITYTTPLYQADFLPCTSLKPPLPATSARQPLAVTDKTPVAKQQQQWGRDCPPSPPTCSYCIVCLICCCCCGSLVRPCPLPPPPPPPLTCPLDGWYRFSSRAMHELLPPPDGPTNAST